MSNYARSGEEDSAADVKDSKCIWIGNLYTPHKKYSVNPGCSFLKWEKDDDTAGADK